MSLCQSSCTLLRYEGTKIQGHRGTEVQRYKGTCHPGTFGGCPSFRGRARLGTAAQLAAMASSRFRYGQDNLPSWLSEHMARPMQGWTFSKHIARTREESRRQASREEPLVPRHCSVSLSFVPPPGKTGAARYYALSTVLEPVTLQLG